MVFSARHSRESGKSAACRTHLRNVSGAPPSFDDPERIADHCESCSPGWSRTSLTARSRTSGEYFVDGFRGLSRRPLLLMLAAGR